MKIDPIRGSAKSSGPKKKRRTDESGASAFRDALDSADSKQDNELDDLFDKIDQSCHQLRENPRLEYFKNYRERVGRFIKLFLEQSYDVKLTSEMTLTGRQRHLVLVKNIDENLEKMYHLFMQEIFDIEEMFKGLEDIRGMLLDLYQ